MTYVAAGCLPPPCLFPHVSSHVCFFPCMFLPMFPPCFSPCLFPCFHDRSSSLTRREDAQGIRLGSSAHLGSSLISAHLSSRLISHLSSAHLASRLCHLAESDRLSPLASRLSDRLDDFSQFTTFQSRLRPLSSDDCSRLRVVTVVTVANYRAVSVSPVLGRSPHLVLTSSPLLTLSSPCPNSVLVSSSGDGWWGGGVVG